MKINKYFLIGSIAIAGLSSCVSETLDSDQLTGGKGRMALDVSILEPAATRAQSQVTNFPVIVYNAEGAVVENYNSVSDVPTSVVLSVGNYLVESHTPGAIQKKMTTPYYKGTAEMEIVKDVTTNVDVICKMLNSSIKVEYTTNEGQTVADAFTSWTITIDDGGETALTFTSEEGMNPATLYWYFDNNVSSLNFNFRAVTSEGSTVTARRTLTKNQAQESYDDDNQYFGGGDAIVIQVAPTESTEGKVTGITINASVTFSETEEVVNLDVTDDTSNLEPGTDPGTDPGTNPGGNDDLITLSLPAPISYPFLGAASVDKSLGDTEIKAEKGLKSIKVKIESTSSEMISSVGDLNTNYGVDFINGAEIVGNQSVVTLFNDLNQPLSVPAEGDTEYTFPIGNFFELLQVLVGTHTFHLTVTDMEGNVKSGTVVITVTA